MGPRAVLLALLLVIVVPVDGASAVPYRYGCRVASTATFTVQPVMEGLNFPVSMAVAPDGRIFFNELKTGQTRIIRDGVLLVQPFSQFAVATQGEQGLLGLALHPDFAMNPQVYVYYTAHRPQGGVENRVVALTAEGDVASGTTVVMDRLPASGIHNSGILVFGPDGKLYVTVGDASEPQLAQDVAKLNGKVLRLNPDGTVPGDNPLPRNPVYALGLRNPFGMAFSPGGMLYVTDNGPDRNDEVNIIAEGGNYGWPTFTGFSSAPGFHDPILNYTPTVAPTGIGFYSGRSLRSDLYGIPFFGTWNTREIRQVILDGCSLQYRDPVSYRATAGVLDIEMGVDGHLYFTTQDSIYRVVGPPLHPPGMTGQVTIVATSLLAPAALLLGRWRRIRDRDAEIWR